MEILGYLTITARSCYLRRDRTGLRTAAAPRPADRPQLTAALGDAQSVLNVGAGSGSYEPSDRAVVAVEPSGVMVARSLILPLSKGEE